MIKFSFSNKLDPQQDIIRPLHDYCSEYKTIFHDQSDVFDKQIEKYEWNTNSNSDITDNIFLPKEKIDLRYTLLNASNENYFWYCLPSTWKQLQKNQPFLYQAKTIIDLGKITWKGSVKGYSSGYYEWVGFGSLSEHCIFSYIPKGH